MKAKHHFWSSIAAGGLLYWAAGSASAFAGAMVGGFLIDADHAVDQWWSIRHGAPLLGRYKNPGQGTQPVGARAWLAGYFRRRKLVRLPLVFHSYELLLLLALFLVLLKTPFIVGLFTGYALHIALDIWRHHSEFRSPLFYLLTYRLAHGFRRDKLIKPRYQ